ncbi:LisH domain-containing protein [Entamoeba marina]
MPIVLSSINLTIQMDLNKEVKYIILEYLSENKDMATFHSYSKEEKLFFDKKYFIELIRNGSLTEADDYCLSFIDMNNNPEKQLMFNLRRHGVITSLMKKDIIRARHWFSKIKEVPGVSNDTSFINSLSFLMMLENISESPQISQLGDFDSYCKNGFPQSIEKHLEDCKNLQTYMQFPQIPKDHLKRFFSDGARYKHIRHCKGSFKDKIEVVSFIANTHKCEKHQQVTHERSHAQPLNSRSSTLSKQESVKHFLHEIDIAYDKISEISAIYLQDNIFCIGHSHGLLLVVDIKIGKILFKTNNTSKVTNITINYPYLAYSTEEKLFVYSIAHIFIPIRSFNYGNIQSIGIVHNLPYIVCVANNFLYIHNFINGNLKGTIPEVVSVIAHKTLDNVITIVRKQSISFMEIINNDTFSESLICNITSDHIKIINEAIIALEPSKCLIIAGINKDVTPINVDRHVIAGSSDFIIFSFENSIVGSGVHSTNREFISNSQFEFAFYSNGVFIGIDLSKPSIYLKSNTLIEFTSIPWDSNEYLQNCAELSLPGKELPTSRKQGVSTQQKPVNRKPTDSDVPHMEKRILIQPPLNQPEPVIPQNQQENIPEMSFKIGPNLLKEPVPNLRHVQFFADFHFLLTTNSRYGVGVYKESADVYIPNSQSNEIKSDVPFKGSDSVDHPHTTITKNGLYMIMSNSKKCKLIRVSTGLAITPFHDKEGEEEAVTCVSVYPTDSNSIILGQKNGKIVIYKANKRFATGTSDKAMDSPIISFIFLNDPANTFLAVSSNGKVQLVDYSRVDQTNQPIFLGESKSFLGECSFAFADEQQTYLYLVKEKDIQVIDIKDVLKETQPNPTTLKYETKIKTVAVSRNGKLLLVVTENKVEIRKTNSKFDVIPEKFPLEAQEIIHVDSYKEPQSFVVATTTGNVMTFVCSD